MIAEATRKRQKIDVSAGTGPSCSLMAYQVRPQMKTTTVNNDAFKSHLAGVAAFQTLGIGEPGGREVRPRRYSRRRQAPAAATLIAIFAFAPALP